MIKENEFIFQQAIRTADILVAMFGPRCEVAVHDFNNLERSLIYLAGTLTGREIGAPITDLVLQQLRNGDSEVQDIANYKTVSKSGKVMKSSTVYLRDPHSNVIGALCINLDISLLIQLGGEISDFIQFDDEKKKKENFYSTVQDVTEGMVHEVLQKFNKVPALLDTDEKIECVRKLENRGAFLIKGAVEYLADLLGVSKYTVYNYLQKIRTEATFHSH
ncbi:MAG TPA: PAS domain-containing protein [Bacillales bacterium]|nr:PAS domain-containing protein [Bacillales bacterium]